MPVKSYKFLGIDTKGLGIISAILYNAIIQYLYTDIVIFIMTIFFAFIVVIGILTPGYETRIVKEMGVSVYGTLILVFPLLAFSPLIIKYSIWLARK